MIWFLHLESNLLFFFRLFVVVVVVADDDDDDDCDDDKLRIWAHTMTQFYH